ncbi:uncharacterized protein ARMOST_06526 [Armillaria ostoyae]|uniref:F-box domain-containing protein n=1 Tax=Armillaria ostoyae TaxID=47428 RepID=A0A284R385_ARMOS|nr:uncharacterized protein ARMOST_06526 [Armillaria ostoyae]
MSSLYKCEGFIVEDLSTIPDILPYVSTVVFHANSARPFNIADTIKVLSLLPGVDHLDFRNIEFDMCSDRELEELSKACQNVNTITMLSCTISTDSLNALLLHASHIWNLEFGRDMVYDLSGLSLKEHVATALGAIRAIDMVVRCGHDWYQYMWLNYVTFQSLKVIRFAMQDDEARHVLELLVASSVAVEQLEICFYHKSS